MQWWILMDCIIVHIYIIDDKICGFLRSLVQYVSWYRWLGKSRPLSWFWLYKSNCKTNLDVTIPNSYIVHQETDATTITIQHVRKQLGIQQVANVGEPYVNGIVRILNVDHDLIQYELSRYRKCNLSNWIVTSVHLSIQSP